MSVGFDVGTYNLVCCKRNEKGDFVYKREVNAFLSMPLDNEFVFNMMKMAGVPLIKREDANVAYALGEASVNMAYTMTQLELSRPMKDGCVNPKEQDAFQIMNVMIHSLLDEVQKDKEILYYCVPANAINEQTDAEYHQKIVEAIFKAYKSENGYTVDARPINEGMALVYAELKDKMFTGVGVSCLCPGTKVYTNKGLKNIEDVVEGDEVFTHKGRWRTVYDTVPTFFSGTKTKIKLWGYSGPTETYEFVDNHKLYVLRNDQWQWIGCEEIKVGDIVGEPIEKNDSIERPEIEVLSRNTCSKIWKTTHYNLSPEMCELIGYFLGDGSVNLKEGCFQLDFAKHEHDNIERVMWLIKEVFGKKSSKTKKGKNCTRIKCYQKAIAKWFKNNCYNDNKDKKCPFVIGCLTDEEAKSLLCGLIKSDGMITESHISFFNSNSHLAHVCKQLFGRCGIAASLGTREPRNHYYELENRVITDKKVSCRVNTSAQLGFNILQESLNFKREINSNYRPEKRITNKVENGFMLSTVKSIETEPYTGLVHDLRVAEDHSFSGPNLVIKNCGAGMINVAYSLFGAPVFTFAIVNSGDWIDKQAAHATGETIAFINKEKTKIDLNKEPTNLIERAIITQYQLMIEKTVVNIKKGFENNKQKNAKLDAPIDFIVAGGTASPPGFDKFFEKLLREAKLSVDVGRVIRPDDPLYSVARGCLIASENVK